MQSLSMSLILLIFPDSFLILQINTIWKMVRRVTVTLIIRDNLCFFQAKRVSYQDPIDPAAKEFAVKLVLSGKSGLGLL